MSSNLASEVAAQARKVIPEGGLRNLSDVLSAFVKQPCDGIPRYRVLGSEEFLTYSDARKCILEADIPMKHGIGQLNMLNLMHRRISAPKGKATKDPFEPQS